MYAHVCIMYANITSLQLQMTIRIFVYIVVFILISSDELIIVHNSYSKATDSFALPRGAKFLQA